ncbi:MAG: MFS transporter [Thiohalospira sp.]
MTKYLTIIASFVIMLCLGGVYAWSIIASELIENHNFSSAQTQIIFGALIAIFPVTMIFVGKLASFINPKFLATTSGIFFFLGYLTAGLSNGNFYLFLLGIGILSGMGTGFGYWVSISIPVQWFPARKGLIAGIAAAGFGLGALIFSSISEAILLSGKTVFQLLIITGASYGIVILFFSNYITQKNNGINLRHIKLSDFLNTKLFVKSFLGIFFGTFAGLLVIGSLKLIGEQYNIRNHFLILGVSIFAIANFLGRLLWGWISDYIGASITIFIALLLQSIGIFLLNIVLLSDFSFIFLSALIGLGFGCNFVLFVKETAQNFGIINLGIIYPYVFLGYALAGITGPLIGGILYDILGTYSYSIIIAGFVSLLGGLLYFLNYLKIRKDNNDFAK